EVDLYVVEGQRRRGQVDRPLLAYFHLVEVADRVAVFDPAGPLDGAGGRQQLLDQGRLARSRMADQDDIAYRIRLVGRWCPARGSHGPALVRHFASRVVGVRANAAPARGVRNRMDAVCSPNTHVAQITRGPGQRKSPAPRCPTIEGAMLKLLRPAMTRILTPLGRALVRRGIGPDAVTAIGTLGTVVSALFFFPQGMLTAGALVITVFVLFDLLDGVVARLGGGGGSTWGAFLDSTLDRVADAAIFSGLILHFIATGDALLAGVTLFALVAGMLVSYA